MYHGRALIKLARSRVRQEQLDLLCPTTVSITIYNVSVVEDDAGQVGLVRKGRSTSAWAL